MVKRTPAEPVRVEHARLAAAHVVAIDQDHGDIIDAVAMRAFRRGPADALGSVDAELMRFDVPRSTGRRTAARDCRARAAGPPPGGD